MTLAPIEVESFTDPNLRFPQHRQCWSHVSSATPSLERIGWPCLRAVLSPLSRHRCTHRIALATPTPNRSAACHTDDPASTASSKRPRSSPELAPLILCPFVVWGEESHLGRRSGIPAVNQRSRMMPWRKKAPHNAWGFWPQTAPGACHWGSGRSSLNLSSQFTANRPIMRQFNPITRQLMKIGTILVAMRSVIGQGW